MNITAWPHWEWWLVGYFFLGGIAGGSFFIAGLMELVGNEQDHKLARGAYYLGLPLILICTVFLILGLGQPLRFWHMLLQSETLRPMFKWWSPMSYGSWILAAFGGVAFLAFIDALAEDRRIGNLRFARFAEGVRKGILGKLFAVLMILLGFGLASYTGSLLSATNVPFWSDTPFLGGLFLASGVSTGIAAMLVMRSRKADHEALAKLERADTFALGLELVMLLLFFVSLGSLALRLVTNPFGLVILIGTALFGLAVPLLLRLRPRLLGNNTFMVAALLVLAGGVLLRFGILWAGRSVTVVAG